MSVSLMSDAYASTVEDPTELAVLLSLANYAGEHGECWPSVARVATDTRLSRRTVQRKLQHLISAQHVSCLPNKGRAGSNRYIVHPKLDSRKSEKKGSGGGVGVALPWEAGGDTEAPGGVTESAGGRQSDAQTTKNRQNHHGAAAGATGHGSNLPAPVQLCKLGEALARAEGANPAQMTDSGAAAIRTALAQIRGASPDVTAEEISRRAVAYGDRFDPNTLTAFALAKHWAKLRPAPDAGDAETPDRPAEEPENWGVAWANLYPDDRRPDCFADVPGILLPDLWGELSNIGQKSRKKNEGGGGA